LEIQNYTGNYNTFSRKKQEEKQSDQTKQPDQTPYVKARHQYKRTVPNSTNVDKFIKKTSIFDKSVEANVKAEMNSMLNTLMMEAKKKGRFENTSFSPVVVLNVANFIFHGKQLSDEQEETVVKAFDRISGRYPSRDNMTDIEKQELVDDHVLYAMVIFSRYNFGVQSQDSAAIKEAEDGLRFLLQKNGLGVNRENFASVLKNLLEFGSRQ
jgi:ATPase subunit of ABC transporter with duplicated ATPase domains